MLIALAGPTASGKSALALELAAELSGEILCADSRQIYRGLDIGSAKPSVAERQRVPHHLFDIADPRDTYTVAQYQRAAEDCLESLQQSGKIPLLVGGTGLYFRTLLYDYGIPAVPPQPELRAQLEAEEATDPGCLHRRLQAWDPAAAHKIHAQDLRRIVRALEVQTLTGKPISQQQRAGQLRAGTYYLALSLPQEWLYERIQTRIEAMIAEGLIEEVQTLQREYGADLPLLQTLNYAEIAAYLAGQWDLATAKEQMFIHTRQYAKRQRTWFRRDRELQWFVLERAADLPRVQKQVREAVLRLLEQEAAS